MSLEITPRDKTAELHGLNIKDGADTFMELNLEAKSDVDSLIDFISKAAKGEV